MTNQRVVVWLTENNWAPTVDAAAALPGTHDIVLLHVIDTQVGEAAHGAFGGLLGRGSRQRNPGDILTQMARDASSGVLNDAQRRLSTPARLDSRAGRIEREVVAACEDADLLICARDGNQKRLGPHSLGHHTRFVIDHAPCAVLLIWPDTVPDLDSIPPPPQPGTPHPHR
ncbi:MAG: universal stress protein [Actinomycetota bacterium]|nr:universal stress protein [Actinomycetota bacterium]